MKGHWGERASAQALLRALKTANSILRFEGCLRF